MANLLFAAPGRTFLLKLPSLDGTALLSTGVPVHDHCHHPPALRDNVVEILGQRTAPASGDFRLPGTSCSWFAFLRARPSKGQGGHDRGRAGRELFARGHPRRCEQTHQWLRRRQQSS